jgi:hypothetical protein
MYNMTLLTRITTHNGSRTCCCSTAGVKVARRGAITNARRTNLIKEIIQSDGFLPNDFTKPAKQQGSTYLIAKKVTHSTFFIGFDKEAELIKLLTTPGNSVRGGHLFDQYPTTQLCCLCE